MVNAINIPVALTVAFFILPIAFKVRKKEKIELSDLIRYTITSIGLPHLVICLYLLITDPKTALNMAEAPQLLAITVLISIYLALGEIKKILNSKNPNITS